MNRIFGKDEGPLPEFERPPRKPRHDEADDKKRAVLAVSVTAVTMVIVAAWLLTLPMQLDKFQILDDESVARWYVIREEMNEETGGLQAQLDNIKEQLDEAAGELKIASDRGDETGDGSIVPEDVAERLRAKIMESESINQNEQDATTQED